MITVRPSLCFVSSAPNVTDGARSVKTVGQDSCGFDSASEKVNKIYFHDGAIKTNTNGNESAFTFGQTNKIFPL